jgi:hypothetical protein
VEEAEMALFGSQDVTIMYGAVDVTEYIQSLTGLGIEYVTQDSQPFGQRANQVKYTGALKVDDVVAKGLFDNQSNGPLELWGKHTTPSPADAPVNLVINIESGSPASSITVPVLVSKFETGLTRNQITEYTATFKKGVGDIVVV